ncbi:LAETG motif-containing sortase-dependent surface protein [Streptomyces sp. BI20]|uniref:LAETG motif-containing sortase-dependent surface protein n=1 Tax=Streptomyces sp. BI20 TaxID=3403460 RepID=UPI003C717D61
MSARRPLVTAVGATALLGALWFVPSANAGAPASHELRAAAAPVGAARPDVRAADRPAEREPAMLAATGGVDTTPYLWGGSAFLVVGAGFVVFSARRSRAAGETDA